MNLERQLIRKHRLCKMLDMTAEGLGKLIARDESFPRPIKLGNTRGAAVVFDLVEVNNWLEGNRCGSA
ncbi:MAG: AlpA family phage regulatory protein, partial [Marinospirillum sp.]|uniref:helix-turn-helix transcriptional regulator n=1 Tax=Marinospirillum sp. TaxID=2183934 RepID=UPI001A0C551F